MTEYIILVGLIGILLIAAVTTFKEQIRVTIEGSAGAVDDISNRMPAGNGNGPLVNPPGGGNVTYNRTDRTTPNGDRIYSGTDGVDYIESRPGVYVPAP